MKNKTRQIVALLVTAAMLTGCGAVQNQDVVSEQTKTQEETQTESVEEIQSKADTATEYSVIGQRPRLISTTADSSENISPAADSYILEKDLSNVDNLWQFYLDDKMTELLAKNGFVVREEAGREFFDLYERNRYNMIPNFVTVDSLMHTYHVYFAYLLKHVEKEDATESAETTPSSATAAADGSSIVVQSGEGAGSIAARAGISVDELERLNPDHMTSGYWYANPGDVVNVQ